MDWNDFVSFFSCTDTVSLSVVVRRIRRVNCFVEQYRKSAIRGESCADQLQNRALIAVALARLELSVRCFCEYERTKFCFDTVQLQKEAELRSGDWKTVVGNGRLVFLLVREFYLSGNVDDVLVMALLLRDKCE